MSRERPAGAATSSLPDDYAGQLKEVHLAPLWSSIRSLIPRDLPQRKTTPALWRYADVRRLLVQSGQLVPIELAERRALVLCNPGHGEERLRATPSIFIGLWIISRFGRCSGCTSSSVILTVGLQRLQSNLSFRGSTPPP